VTALRLDNAGIALGGRPILSDVSFAVASGEFVGVMGPNGAGKTTLFRALLGLVPPSAGRIEVLGTSPRRGNADIGYVPQSRRAAAQLNFTALDLLLSARAGHRWGFPGASAEARAEVAAVLDRVGAAALADRPFAELSGGERQRLFIAQALLGSPRLLLLDEPLISLDPAHQRTIVELVRDIARERNIAVLFSAHEINPLLRAIDRVLYLGGGHAAIGAVDEVISEPVLSSLYRTRVRVIRVEGRIFVIAEDGSLDGHEHDHDDSPHHHHESAH
jgi:zinc/manganese transport system ATP-binding protein